MAAHARLNNEFTVDEKYHNLMSWLKASSTLFSWMSINSCAQWVVKDPVFLHADSEDSYQTGRMPRPISLCLAHRSFCWFCHEAAQLCCAYPASRSAKRGAASTIFNDWYVVARDGTRFLPFPGADTLPTELPGQVLIPVTFTIP